MLWEATPVDRVKERTGCYGSLLPWILEGERGMLRVPTPVERVKERWILRVAISVERVKEREECCGRLLPWIV